PDRRSLCEALGPTRDGHDVLPSGPGTGPLDQDRRAVLIEEPPRTATDPRRVMKESADRREHGFVPENARTNTTSEPGALLWSHPTPKLDHLVEQAAVRPVRPIPRGQRRHRRMRRVLTHDFSERDSYADLCSGHGVVRDSPGEHD